MKPFSTFELRSVFAKRMAAIEADIERFSDDQMMANDLEVLASNLYEQHRPNFADALVGQVGRAHEVAESDGEDLKEDQSDEEPR